MGVALAAAVAIGSLVVAHRRETVGGEGASREVGSKVPSTSQSASVDRLAPDLGPAKPAATEISRAQDVMMAKSLVSSFIEAVERGDVLSSSRLRASLVDRGEAAREAVDLAVAKPNLREETRTELRRLHGEIR
jgi:hypothetical protein